LPPFEIFESLPHRGRRSVTLLTYNVKSSFAPASPNGRTRGKKPRSNRGHVVLPNAQPLSH
jgi:hypothetical protein